jgi:hypothetical protein
MGMDRQPERGTNKQLKMRRNKSPKKVINNSPAGK